MPKFIPRENRIFISEESKKRIRLLESFGDSLGMCINEADRLVKIIKETKHPVTKCQDMLRSRAGRLGLLD